MQFKKSGMESHQYEEVYKLLKCVQVKLNYWEYN